jgi:hypothetical protein
MITWEWLGGFTDGEGSFGVMVYVRKDRSRLEVQPGFSIPNTDTKLIIQVASFLDTKHYRATPQSENWSPQERILIKGKKLLSIIPQLYPYLNSENKRKCGRLVWIMEYFLSLNSRRRAPFLTIEFLAKLTQRIRECNSRKGSKRYRWGYQEMLDFYTKRVWPEPREVIFAHIKATPELIQKAKIMRKEGASYRMIGRELGISHRTASMWCALA